MNKRQAMKLAKVWIEDPKRVPAHRLARGVIRGFRLLMHQRVDRHLRKVRRAIRRSCKETIGELQAAGPEARRLAQSFGLPAWALGYARDPVTLKVDGVSPGAYSASDELELRLKSRPLSPIVPPDFLQGVEEVSGTI